MGSGDEGITLYTGTGSAGCINFADGTSGSESYMGRILYRHGDNAMSFHTNTGTERMRILSGGGITFNGDTAAANALDDFEEGSWTPTAFYGSGSFSAVNNAVCRYVKIGSLVHISGRFSLTGGGSGELQIGGLPFAKNNPGGDGNSAGIQIYVEGAASNITNSIVGLVIDNTTLILVRRGGTTASGGDMAGLVDGGTTLLIGGTYMTGA